MNWEYKKVSIPTMGEIQLSELGSIGWEHYFVDGHTHYFKRPLINIPENNADKKNATKSKR